MSIHQGWQRALDLATLPDGKKSRTSSTSKTLAEQLQEMADKGAVLKFRGSIIPEGLGLIRVDEDEKRLFYMRRWALGTGDVHIFRWGNHDRNEIYVSFYRAPRPTQKYPRATPQSKMPC
jgi:hypothetical protein